MTQGLENLAHGIHSAPAPLVAVEALRLRALGREADREGRAHLTGGSTAVSLGWRAVEAVTRGVSLRVRGE